MADETTEQLRSVQIDDVKKSIRESDQIPITVGNKKQLVPRDTFMSEGCPANDITRILREEKDFMPQFGFISIPEADQDAFDAFVDFLELRDELMLPRDSEALESVLKLAQGILIKICNVGELLAKIKYVQVWEVDCMKWLLTSSRGDFPKLITWSRPQAFSTQTMFIRIPMAFSYSILVDESLLIILTSKRGRAFWNDVFITNLNEYVFIRNDKNLAGIFVSVWIVWRSKLWGLEKGHDKLIKEPI